MDGTDSFAHHLIWDDSLADELRCFLLRRLKCADTAADLTQETYLRLRQYQTKGSHDNARALAFHIAMNLAVDYQRKTEVRRRYFVENDIESATEQAGTDLVEPERRMIAEERLLKLQNALTELPAECRTVFLLHGVQGLKYSEIADRLGLSVSMVGKHLARAMAHCSQRVDE
ncbi:MAG: RNA polymerase sigma factor [Gammaproteobacteria bacterium]